MSWYLRAIEVDDGRWACRHGRHEYDAHPNLSDAVAHLRELAGDLGDVELFAHPRVGLVRRIGTA